MLAMRRRPGTLVPFELAICEAAAALRRRRISVFHGYLIAKALNERPDAPVLTGHGTLYRALARLEAMKLLESRWEDPDAAAREHRPRRKLYTLTAAADAALADARPRATRRVPAKKRWAPA